MPKIPEIDLSDIDIAEEHTRGYNYERCREGLWSIYSVIKKIISSYPNSLPLHYSSRDEYPTYTKLLECLYMIGVNAQFEESDMSSLAYSGKTNKKYKRGMPATKYLFELEKYGFVFYDLVTSKRGIPKSKLTVKDISQFSFSYNTGDFSDVILGLKLFSDICIKKTGDCFYAADIRIAFVDASKLYAPPLDEVFYFLPEKQKKLAYTIHDKLEEIGCVRNLEREYMTKYMHPKSKGQVFATIFSAEHLYFLLESYNQQKLTFKFILITISKYTNYLSECTELVRQSIIESEDCGMCYRKCGGVIFTYQGITYAKCVTHIFRFNDLSEKAIENYIELIGLENEYILGKK